MADHESAVEIYLEVGQKRTFAVAPQWPGWCRSGRDEDSALQALVEYGPRYARAIEQTRIMFQPPADVSVFTVIERLQGDATTDFGAPGLALPVAVTPLTPGDLECWHAILLACWDTFDAALRSASGRELRKGPRGGGRDLAKMVSHVLEANVGYLASLGGKLKLTGEEAPTEALQRVRQAMLTTLDAAARGDIPARGPRGGERWKARTFVRRVAWHELDHAWEIEDRVT